MMDFAKRTGQAKLCDSLLAANPQLWKKFQHIGNRLQGNRKSKSNCSNHEGHEGRLKGEGKTVQEDPILLRFNW